jgi:hypothetical protein
VRSAVTRGRDTSGLASCVASLAGWTKELYRDSGFEEMRRRGEAAVHKLLEVAAGPDETTSVIPAQ